VKAMVIIIPVLELRDLFYAHKYRWLNALVRVTEGIMLRPEPDLGIIFRSGKKIKEYLVEKWGVSKEILDKIKIMLDHGINSFGFEKFFGLNKTPYNIVYVYHRLGVDLGIAFDVPLKLYVSAALNLALYENLDIYIDVSVKDIVLELAELIKKRIKDYLDAYNISDRKVQPRLIDKAREIIKHDSSVHDILRKLSRVGVEETLARLNDMIKYADQLGFKGIVPVIQGLFYDDIERCIRDTFEIMSKTSKEFLIAIGTGGRVLSTKDINVIRFVINKIKEYASKNNVSVRIHVLGWSSANKLHDIDILKYIYSADSLTVRRRAIEGKIFTEDGNKNVLRLIHVSQLSYHGLNCDCPACQDPTLKTYILDPSGARRNDVRIVHNIYVITRSIDKRLSNS